jgi:hypothetical protein
MDRRLKDGNSCLNGQLGRPKMRWEDDVLENVRSTDIRNWKEVARNREMEEERARTL